MGIEGVELHLGGESESPNLCGDRCARDPKLAGERTDRAPFSEPSLQNRGRVDGLIENDETNPEGLGVMSCRRQLAITHL